MLLKDFLKQKCVKCDSNIDHYANNEKFPIQEVIEFDFIDAQIKIFSNDRETATVKYKGSNNNRNNYLIPCRGICSNCNENIVWQIDITSTQLFLIKTFIQLSSLCLFCCSSMEQLTVITNSQITHNKCSNSLCGFIINAIGELQYFSSCIFTYNKIDSILTISESPLKKSMQINCYSDKYFVDFVQNRFAKIAIFS